MAAKKKPVKKKTPAIAPKRRRPASTAKRSAKKGAGKVANFVVPLFFIVCIVVCLGFLGMMGYRTVTASDFFDVKKIDVRGVSRASRDEIEKIVAGQTERSGVWNADIAGIKDRVEKLMFVKTAAVSRVLPDGVRVDVTERVPQAIVRLGSGDFLVDGEGVVLTTAPKPEENMPFAMRGWDESKTEKASKDNIERVKLYQKMLDEWRTYELAARIKEVNLADVRDPKVIVEDSGVNIPIAVGKDTYGKRLMEGLKVLAGKGARDVSVNSAGLYPVLEYPNK
jgi:cell division septal protein FtsQ